MNVSHIYKDQQETTITRESNTSKGENQPTALKIIAITGSLKETATPYSSLGPSSNGEAPRCVLTLNKRRDFSPPLDPFPTGIKPPHFNPTKKESEVNNNIQKSENEYSKIETNNSSQMPNKGIDPLTVVEDSNLIDVSPKNELISENVKTGQENISPQTLPFILSVTIESSSPLQKMLPFEDFIDPNYKLKPERTEDVYEIFSDSLLLGIHLQYYIYRQPDDYNWCLKIINDPRRSRQVNLINERIDQLDKAIQLKERLKGLAFSSDLTIKNLLPAWKDANGLKYELSQNADLSQITVSSILSLNPNQVWKAIERRYASCGKERKNDLSDLPIEDIPLIDLPRVTASSINKSPHEYPGFICLMISPDELAKIDTSKLTHVQMESLFYPYYGGSKCVFDCRIKKLLPHQIDACLSRFDKKNLHVLTDDQVVGLDHTKINAEMYKRLFYLNVKERISRLTIDSIHVLFPFFSENGHWKFLSDEQIRAFDFSKVEESKRKEVFNLIFREIGKNINGSQFLSLLSKSQLNSVMPYLDN